MTSKTLTNAEYAILGLLVEADSHGYDLEKKITDRGMRDWTEIGFSSIYFILGKLEKKGMATAGTASGARARKVFSVTPKGKEAHKHWTVQAIADPHPLYPSVLLGLANWPALAKDQALEALRMRVDALQSTLLELENRKRLLGPLPDFVEVQFNYSITQIRSEIDWAREGVAIFSGEKDDQD